MKLKKTTKGSTAHTPQEVELLFRSFVQQNIDGIILIDSDGIVKEWNASMESLSGFTSKAMLGIKAWEMQFLINHEEKPSLEQRRQLEDIYMNILRTGIVPESMQSRETTLTTKEGVQIPVEQKAFIINTNRGNWLGVIIMDLTERRQTEEKLRELEAQLKNLNNNIFNGYTYQIDFGLHGELRNFLYISAGVEKLMDISVDQVLESWEKFSEFFLSNDNHEVAELEDESLATMTPFTVEVRFRHKEGRIGWLLLHSTPRKLSNDHLVWDGVALDITERKLIQEEMQRLAITDPLTGLFNRRHFFEIAEKEFSKSLRYQRPLSVIILDIDQFKETNDTFGHLAGDQVLIQIGSILRENEREFDLSARYGGEEFVILLPETTCTRAMIVAQRLRSLMENYHVDIGKDTIRFTASFGVAGHDKTNQSETFDQLISQADMALYEAKGTGRNRVASYCTK